jgi:succinate dehydrogenase / fumarate reductase cytochrome b subunit
MAQSDRPLSPHLQVYRPQLTSVLSIFHRGTGVVLATGTFFLTFWLIAAAWGDAAFSFVQAFYGSWFGYLILFGFSVCLFYHMCNGVRHLFWDVGIGFDIDTLYRSGWSVLIISSALTVFAWFIGLAAGD